MDIDLKPFFAKYETLVMMVDGVFERIKKEYPECVKCKIECSDCCHALFDLTLIEALYINHHFNKKFEGEEKAKLIDKANIADRKIYKIKRKAYKELEKGRKEEEILAEMAQERVRCPLLNDQDKCDLYEYRPITCRFYGIPTSIGGAAHTCGKSGFVKGKQYPTVNLDIIHKQLYGISEELVKEIKTKYVKMADMIIPVSMAMLTVFDEEYLGIIDEKKADERECEGNERIIQGSGK